ncbi:DUF551 domain-containing protein [Salmonella enterica]|uniref:DUF551 domain-containing protein n=1 Tax=Salmonella enterica TaxID=28901 RepID=UPI002119481D|nr:DUF551 domain-containing protein [Salmonella enterica]
MTTITRERAQEIFLGNGPEPTASEQRELARIALASMGAEPVAWMCEDEEGREYNSSNEFSCSRFGVPLYAAPPAPVVPEKLPCSVELKPGLIIGKGCKTETLLTALRRRADYYAKIDAFTSEERAEHDASIEAFKAMLPTPADSQGRPRAPVVPPAIEPDYKVIKSILPTANPDEYACCIAADMWNACRATMLQDNQRDLSQPVDPQVAEYEQIMLQAGNSPVTQDGWISCSERMPEDEQEVIVHNKLGYRYVSYFDEHSGLFFDMRGGNQMNCIEHILVTHWRPMPAPPEPEQS